MLSRGYADGQAFWQVSGWAPEAGPRSRGAPRHVFTTGVMVT
jgi:hypothetical protein